MKTLKTLIALCVFTSFSFAQEEILEESSALPQIAIAAPGGYFSDFSAVNALKGYEFTKLIEQAFLNQNLAIIDTLIQDDKLKSAIQTYFKSIQEATSTKEWRVHGHANYSFSPVTSQFVHDYSLTYPEKVYKNHLTLFKIQQNINVWLRIEYTFHQGDKGNVLDGCEMNFLFKDFSDNPYEISSGMFYPEGLDKFNSTAKSLFYPYFHDTKYKYAERVLQNKQIQIQKDSLLNEISFLSDQKFYQKLIANLELLEANQLGGLSWYALLEGDFAAANEFAKKGLALEADQEWINTNLAVSYLGLDQYKKAKKIYKKFANVHLAQQNTKYVNIFIKDIEDLRKKNVDHENFEKALVYLKSLQK